VKKTLEITSGTLNDWKNDNIMALQKWEGVKKNISKI